MSEGPPGLLAIACSLGGFNIRAKESPGFEPWGGIGANLHTDASVDTRMKPW
jgi:hypothetical protein